MHNPEEDYQCMLDKLNTIREQKNMSKYALAKAAGMSSSSMSDLLNGKSKPYLYNMLLICNALRIPLGELFEKNMDYIDCSDEKRIISAYRAMPLEKQRMLQVYVDMLSQCVGEVWRGEGCDRIV